MFPYPENAKGKSCLSRSLSAQQSQVYEKGVTQRLEDIDNILVNGEKKVVVRSSTGLHGAVPCDTNVHSHK